jgi:uracil-DNA glycosylase family 4
VYRAGIDRLSAAALPGDDARPRASGQLSPDEDFLSLVDAVHACRACPAMTGRTRVLGPANGALKAMVLFVAEAPGRLGADRLAVPLKGDRTGDNFEVLLAETGWSRADVFISNAVLCNPRDTGGRNRPPRPSEVRNCADHLKRLIAVLEPALVVTLGAVALRAASLLDQHGLVLSKHVGHHARWFGRVLVPLYHPSARALMQRPLREQAADYRALRELVDAWPL